MTERFYDGYNTPTDLQIEDTWESPGQPSGWRFCYDFHDHYWEAGGNCRCLTAADLPADEDWC